MKIKNKKKNYSALNKKSKQKITETEFNIGLGILRQVLAFLVVMTHYYKYSIFAQGYFKLIYLKTEKFYFHVPTFFIMAFYFSYKTLVSYDNKKILKRMERICLPYFLWPIIILFVNKLLSRFIIIEKEVTYELLKKQYLFGDKFMPTFWYQCNLIIITILFIVIILIFRDHSNFILIIISIISFIYQYNGKNYQYFKFRKDGPFTLGRIVEMLPCSVVGFNIAYSGIINYFKKHRFKTIIVCIYLSYLLSFYDIFIVKVGYYFNGFKLYLLSILVFIIFALFPSEKIKNKIIINIIKQITNYTAGVYYLHITIYHYIKLYIKFVHNKTLKGCILIYLLCYFICFIGNLIFGKTKLRNLFL